MRFINIFAAVVWLIAMAGLLISWWMEDPVSTAQRFCIAYALVYTTGSTIWKALESLDELMIIGDQRMDRRPRI